MRVVLFAVLAAGLGCGKKDDPAPNVKLAEAEPTPAAGSGTPTPTPTPGQTPAPAGPKSLEKLPFAALWQEHGPAEKPESPEVQLHRHAGLLFYALNDTPYFAAELVGCGPVPGHAVLAAGRVGGQPAVVKNVKAASEKPLVLRTGFVGSTLDMAGGGGGVASRMVVLTVAGSRDELAAGLGRYADGIAKRVTTDPALGPGTATVEGKGLSRKLTYTTPDRKGTITLDVLPADAKPEEVDALLPPAEGSSKFAREFRDGTATLLIVRLAEGPG